jgi:hypothetical protein
LDAGTRRFIAGLAATAAILVFASWFDTTVIVAADAEATRRFDVTGFGVAYGVGGVLVAGLVLAIAGIGWRCRSVRLGIVYAVVGGLLAFLLYIAIELPRSSLGLELTSVLSTLELWTGGPLHAASILGGAMLIVGVAQIVAGIVRRPGRVPTPEPVSELQVPRATIEDVPGPVGS